MGACMATRNPGLPSVVKRITLLACLAGLGLVLFTSPPPGKKPRAPARKKRRAPPPSQATPPRSRRRRVSPPAKVKLPTNQKLPEQKLGDTPVAPTEMPTPAEKAKARPVRRALEQAV